MMRSGKFLAVAVAGLMWGCSPEAPPSVGGPPLTGAENNVLGVTLSDEKAEFSYRMPAGWSATRVPELASPLAQESMPLGYRSNIQVVRERVPLRFDQYLTDGRRALLASVEGAEVLDESDFVTVSGLHGRRWRVHSKVGRKDVLQIFYLFRATGDDKVAMTASCTIDQEPRMVFVFDAAAKTFALRQGP
jgi:hypothetical protein